jgi:hypothetical protein
MQRGNEMSFYDDYFDLDAIVEKKFNKKEKELYEKVCEHFGEQEKTLMFLEENLGVRYVMNIEARLKRLEKLAANPPPAQYVPPPVYGPVPPKQDDILNLLQGKRLKEETDNDTT